MGCCRPDGFQSNTNEYKVNGNLSLTKKYFLWLFLADRSLTKRLPVRVWVGGNMSANNASYMQSLSLCVFIVAVSSSLWVILKYHQHVMWTFVFSTAGAGVHGCELMWFSERRMSLELVRLVLPPHLVHRSIPITIKHHCMAFSMWLLNGSHGGCEQLIGQFGVASSSSRASEIITQRLANEGRSSVLCREREKTKDIWIQDFYMFVSCKRMGSRITRHFQLSIWKSIFKWVNVQLLCMYQKTQLKKIWEFFLF